MMNNFAGPSDTQNFAAVNNAVNSGYADEPADQQNGETPFMGNHIVKTVRNLRMSAGSNRSRQGDDDTNRVSGAGTIG